jgi:diadenosine tetraphosphate (Ap4A) HIT family hydrolase
MNPHPDCPFCAKLAAPVGGANGWAEAEVVWQFPHSVAVLGPWQFYTGYCVLVSREHATELHHLRANQSSFLGEMATLAEAVGACFNPHKLNCELLGNVVPHLHWHVFPRSAHDPERLNPVWLALERAKSDPAEKLRLETGTVPLPEVRACLQRWLTANSAPKL